MNEMALERKNYNVFNKNFILLFFGKFVSQIGDSIYNFGISIYLLELTGKGTVMASYLALSVLVGVLMGPFGGVIADRYDKVKLIYMMDIIRGFAISIAAAVIILKAPIFLIVATLYITGIIIMMCASIFNPSSTSIITEIVIEDYLTKANSISASIQQIASIVGVVFGGILYVIIGPIGIVILNSLSYIGSGISEMFIKIEKGKKEIKADEEVSFFLEIKEGLQYVKQDNLIRSVVMFAVMINLVLAPVFSVIITFVINQVLKAPKIHIAYVEVAFSVGFILGSIIISLIKYEKRFGATLKIGLIFMWLFDICILINIACRMNNKYNNIGFLIIMIIIMMGMGMFNAIVNIPLQVIIQKKVKKELLGRVTALLATLCMMSMPLGMLLGGIAVDCLNIIVVMIVQAILLGGIVITMFLNKNIV